MTDHMVRQGVVLYWSYGEEDGMTCSPMVQRPDTEQAVEIDGERGWLVCIIRCVMREQNRRYKLLQTVTLADVGVCLCQQGHM